MFFAINIRLQRKFLPEQNQITSLKKNILSTNVSAGKFIFSIQPKKVKIEIVIFDTYVRPSDFLA